MATTAPIRPADLKRLQRQFGREFVRPDAGVFGVTVDERDGQAVLVVFAAPDATVDLPATFGVQEIEIERRDGVGGRVAAIS